MRGDDTKMNKYDHDNITSIIRMSEIKLKRIDLSKQHLLTIKPSIFSSKTEITNWKKEWNNLLEEEQFVRNTLYNAYTDLESIVPSKKK